MCHPPPLNWQGVKLLPTLTAPVTRQNELWVCSHHSLEIRCSSLREMQADISVPQPTEINVLTPAPPRKYVVAGATSKSPLCPQEAGFSGPPYLLLC